MPRRRAKVTEWGECGIVRARAHLRAVELVAEVERRETLGDERKHAVKALAEHGRLAHRGEVRGERLAMARAQREQLARHEISVGSRAGGRAGRKPTCRWRWA